MLEKPDPDPVQMSGSSTLFFTQGEECQVVERDYHGCGEESNVEKGGKGRQYNL